MTASGLMWPTDGRKEGICSHGVDQSSLVHPVLVNSKVKIFYPFRILIYFLLLYTRLLGYKRYIITEVIPPSDKCHIWRNVEHSYCATLRMVPLFFALLLSMYCFHVGNIKNSYSTLANEIQIVLNTWPLIRYTVTLNSLNRLSTKHRQNNAYT